MGRRTRTIAALLAILALAGTGLWAQSAGNVRPTARFRALSSGESGAATVVFDATDSQDSDGRIVAYQWVFGDGTTGSGVRLEHTYPKVGLYSVTLLVRDEQGGADMVTERIDLSQLSEDETENVALAAARPPELSAEPPPALMTGPSGSSTGDRAPDFALPSFAGEIVRLSDHLGSIVLVEFFFSTCSGCIASVPHLAELASKRAGEGLVVIVIVLDRNPATAREFFSNPEYQSLIVVREADPSRPTRAVYNVSGVPHLFLVDRAGVIRYTGRPGGLSDEEVEAWL